MREQHNLSASVEHTLSSSLARSVLVETSAHNATHVTRDTHLCQIISGVVQPIFQVLVPGFSEKWFDLRQRTTATMLMSVGMYPHAPESVFRLLMHIIIANPIGSALGQLISPLVGTARSSVRPLWCHEGPTDRPAGA